MIDSSSPGFTKLGFSQKISGEDITIKETDNWVLNWLFNSPHLILAFDIYRSLVNNIWYSFGMELQVAPFAIRLGRFIDFVGARVDRTVGVGLNFKYFKLNVANDANIYDFAMENLPYELTLNLPFKY